jgi:hypothetical protein
LKRLGTALLVVLAVGALAYALWPESEGDYDLASLTRAHEQAERPRSLSVSKTSARPLAPISGRVVDEHGQPLSAEVHLAPDAASSMASEACERPTCHKKLLECGCGAASAKVAQLVSRREGEWLPQESARTDVDGQFAFSARAGRYTLLASAPGYAPAFRRGVANGDSVVLQLGRPSKLAGRVVDEQARPLGGVLVTAVSALLPRFVEATTGPDGGFLLDGLAPGPYYLAANAAGYLPTGLPLKLLAPAPVTITLARPRALVGTVRARGAPAEGATIRLYSDQATVSLLAADGAFRAEGLFPGTYSVSASLGGLAASAQVVLSEPVTRVELVLDEALVALGQVLDSAGLPVPGAALSAKLGTRTIADARTDAQGRFRIEGVASGATLTASAEGYRPASTAVASDGEIVLMLEPLTLVTGRVVSSTGEPLPEVQVLARGASRGVATSDAFGAFRLELEGPGPITLMAHHSLHGAGEVSVEAPASEVRLELSALGSVRARLVDSRGAPVAGARAMAWLEDVRKRNETFSTDSASGEDGALVLAGLEAGVYRVRFSARGYRPAERQNVAVPEHGEVDLGDVELELGERIAGTVLDPDGKPAAGAFVHPRGRGSRAGEGVEVGPEGAFEIVGLQAGTYLLSAFHDKSVGEATARSGDTDVVIRLAAPSLLRGRVLDRGGRPLTRFFVDGAPIDSPDGRFEVAVRAHRDAVIFRVGAERKQTVFRQARLGPDGVAEAGDIVLDDARAVEGTVVDSRANPVAGALVSLNGSDPGARDEQPSSAVSRADGTFRVEGLSPGPVTLVARRGNALGEASVRVPADADVRGARIELSAAGAIEGTIRDSSGRGVFAEIHTRNLSSQSDAQGRYRIDGLPAGSHLVIFMFDSEGLRALTRQVEVSEGETVRLDVDLSGGATLRVTVEGATTGIVHLMKAGPSGQVEADDLSSLQTGQVVEGATAFAGLQGGLYTAVFYGESGELTAHGVVDVREGSAASLTLVVRQPGDMAGSPLPEGLY